MQPRQQDSDLASIRDADALTKLPAKNAMASLCCEQT
jgi:hypothetical protein